MKDEQIKFDLELDKLSHNTIVFCRVGEVHNIRYVMGMIGDAQHFLGFKVRVLIIDKDSEHLKLPVFCDSKVFSGEDWESQLEEFIKSSPGLAAPIFVNYDKEIADKYAKINERVFLKFKPDYSPSPEVKKVMVLGSKFSTMVGPSAKRLAAALVRHGLEVDFFEEKDCYDRLTAMSINKRLMESKPDAFVNMVSPFPIPVNGIKRFCWVQDPSFIPISPECKGYVVGSVCSAFDAQYKLEGFKVERFPMSVDPDEILSHAVDEKDIDISYISNMSLDDPNYRANKPLCDKMIEWAISHITENGVEKYSLKRYKDTVLKCFMEIGANTPQIELGIVYFYMSAIERYAHRIVELRRIIEKHGPVVLYGRGWEDTEFAKYAKGPTKTPLDITARSRQVVHINHHTEEHPRVYEGLLLRANVIGSSITVDDVYSKYTYDARAKQLVELWK